MRIVDVLELFLNRFSSLRSLVIGIRRVHGCAGYDGPDEERYGDERRRVVRIVFRMIYLLV
jgi:hypothetical protein